jgi:hypothetical protein
VYIKWNGPLTPTTSFLLHWNFGKKIEFQNSIQDWVFGAVLWP